MKARETTNSDRLPTKPLAAVLAGIVPAGECGGAQVRDLCLDSRTIGVGDCFVALQGNTEHGLRYLSDVIVAGASAVITDENARENNGKELATIPKKIPVIIIEDLRKQLALISNRVYDFPSESMPTIGVTGTNGKTTIAFILAAALHELGCASAYIGTLGLGPWQHLKATLNTTPDLLTVQRQLSDFRAQGIQSCTLEASSHALDQGRLDGISFEVAVFSNLTHEHLDYHGSMQAYGAAKKKLFSKATGRAPAHAVVNIDDEFGREIVKNAESETVLWPYGMTAQSKNYAHVTAASNLQFDLDGIRMDVQSPMGQGSVQSNLLGSFNAENLLAVIASLGALGWKLPEIVRAIETMPVVPGRMEVIHLDGVSRADLPTVVIDYAHSPDGLEQALITLRRLTRGKLICVFGCGGDRDKSKRPKMGAIAENNADVVIVTSDNSRGERAESIIEQIILGQSSVEQARANKTIVEKDRESAIRVAIKQADNDDVVLIAGKGHECYQIVADQRLHFSDHDVCRHALQARLEGEIT
jgi:UDP-N-acetylmuramoyl-L-alanyl-D-glutamate--2,6-diaminopimelate ligase